MTKKIGIPKEKLEELYLKGGLSSYKISGIYKCDPTVIQNRLNEYKILLIHKKEKINISRERLYELYVKKGFSTYKISKLYDCWHSAIYYKLKDFNIKTRPKKIVHISKNKLNELYINKKLSLSEVAKLYKCSSSIILDKLKNYRIKRRDKFESNMRYERKSFDGCVIEKDYLIGFRIGDLHVKRISDKTIKVNSSTTRLEQVNLIKSLFSDYSHVNSKKGNNCYSNECLLDNSFDFLLEKKDKIKEWILIKNKLFFAFLGGYTDAEGNIGVYTKRARYRVGSYDKGILSQIHKNLNSFGIKSTYRLETKAGTIYGGVRYNGDFWRINVSEMNSLLKLLDNLEPFIKHEKRYKDLVTAKNNIIERINRNGKILYNNTNLLRK